MLDKKLIAQGSAIVLSVLLAFAIDAWWDRLGEKDDERESLLTVQADLEATIDLLEDYADVVARISGASLSAYRALSSYVPSGARDSISDLMVASTVRRTMRLPRSGYTGLVSTGALRLIRDRDIRNQIIRFYADAESLQEIAEKNSTTHTDGHLASVLIRGGLMLKRPIPQHILGLPLLSDDAIRERLGEEFRHRSDPLWDFPPDSPEWNRVRSALLQNSRGTQTNVTGASLIRVQAIELHAAIDSYLMSN